ncbi:MAG: hypothetical protein AAGA56_06925 [Myxococcota bacterium]
MHEGAIVIAGPGLRGRREVLAGQQESLRAPEKGDPASSKEAALSKQAASPKEAASSKMENALSTKGSTLCRSTKASLSANSRAEPVVVATTDSCLKNSFGTTNSGQLPAVAPYKAMHPPGAAAVTNEEHRKIRPGFWRNYPIPRASLPRSVSSGRGSP